MAGSTRLENVTGDPSYSLAMQRITDLSDYQKKK